MPFKLGKTVECEYLGVDLKMHFEMISIFSKAKNLHSSHFSPERPEVCFKDV